MRSSVPEFFFRTPWGKGRLILSFPRFAFSPSIVAHHRRSGQVFTQDQEEMILIGAFGLFWFGKSQVRFIIVPHSAGLPRRSASFCLRLLLSCMAGGPSFLGRHRRGTQGPRTPGVADASCSVIHMTSRDYSFALLCLAFLVAWRAIRQRWSFDGEMGVGGAPNAPRRQPGFTGNAGGGGGYKSWPCSRYDVDCVVEEWSYY